MNERRKHARLRLKIPLLLFSDASEEPVQSETVNISSDGFYCTTKEPFAPGDRLRCLLSLPTPGDATNRALHLDAEVEVMRVRIDREAGFGLGCRIADYHVVNKPDLE